jgi:hypothetical protein
MPEIAVNLFTRTEQLGSSRLAEFQGFLRRVSEQVAPDDDYYTYPALQELVYPF